MKRILPLTALAALLLNAGAAAAEDISVLDTSGTVRAQAEIAEQETGTVTMQVEDTATGGPVADGTEIVLTPASGSPIVGVVSGGEVIFTGLSAQSYTVTSASAVTFTGISITSASVTGGAIAGGSTITATSVAVAGGAVLVVGGATVAIVEGTDSDSKDSGPVSPFR